MERQRWQRPPQVQDSHLSRKAIIYLRQSSGRQVVENTGSAQHQREQARYARKWGWPAGLIEFADDLGRRGGTTLNRPAYLRIMAEVEADLVGAIFLAHLDRVGRESIELFLMLNACRRHNTLLVVAGSVSDLQDEGQLFSQKIFSVVAEYENLRRSQGAVSAKVAKAHAGSAVSRPPRGYVDAATKGLWVFDPDPGVRAAIRGVFETFLRCQTLRETVIDLRRRGVRIPRRGPGGVLIWSEPTVWTVHNMLHNRAYRGDYYFRLHVVDPTREPTESGNSRVRRATAEETIVIANHHEPYVSREEWDQIHHILRLNGPSVTWRNLGPGAAQLQGVLYHEQHPTCVMSPQYYGPRQNGDTRHSYHCPGDYAVGGARCISVPGNPLDHHVSQMVIARLQSPGIEILRDAWRRAAESEQSGDLHRSAELDRARRAVEEAKKRCRLVNPDHRHVAEGYERQWEEAAQHLEQVEAAALLAEQAAPPLFTEDAWKELLLLGQDIGSIWDAESTEHRDRKQLLRTFVDKVLVEARTREFIRARVVWADGTPDEEIEVKLPGYAHRLIVAWAAEGAAPASIAQRLNAEGLVTKTGRPWSRKAVAVMARKKTNQFNPGTDPAT